MRYAAGFAGGDGQPLFSIAHPTMAGTFSNRLTTASQLNETSLEAVFDSNRSYD